MNQFRRPYLLLAAAVTWFALVLQLYLIICVTAPSKGWSPLVATLNFLSFMTIWTNVLCALFFSFHLTAAKSAAAKFFNRPLVEHGIFIYISIVGISYHLFLAHVWSPTGLQKTADVLLHYGVPVLFALWWLLFTPKTRIPFSYVLVWLIYPVVYFVFALLRGQVVGAYPYYFIDVAQLGFSTVMRNALGLLAAYLVFGLVVWCVLRVLSGKTERQ